MKKGLITCMVLLSIVSCQDTAVLPEEAQTETVPEVQEGEEREVKKYTNITEYHWPAELMGKKIVFEESGQGYGFMPDGVYQPTSTMLYPNPVTPDMFNTAIEGKTREEVSEYDTGFTYGLYMQGKFDYNGREYFGEVKVEIRRDGDEWFIGEKVARVE